MVAGDPRALNSDYGLPLYGAELEQVRARHDESDQLVDRVQSYAARHADEFGGLYLEGATRTSVVSLWTDHIAEHAKAIRAAVGADARVAFAQVRYPEAELRALQDEISKDWDADWMADIPAAVETVGVDMKASQVVLEVSSANPKAVAIIESHYGLGDRLRVESDRIGVRFIPWGTVKGRVEPFSA
ncbi:MAG: hypothetical protein WKF56_08910, partial [Candidatus Limnocylindrales bacterium]